MADNYFCTIQPSAVTVDDMVDDFKIVLDFTGDDQGMLHNPKGYRAEDVPDYDSGQILEGTDYFYLIFPLGSGEGALIPLEMGEEGEISCSNPNWSVKSVCVGNQRRFTLMPPPGMTPAEPLKLNFKKVPCNSVSGQAKIELQDKSKKTLVCQFICKCPMPVIEKWEQQNKDPYNIGASGNLRCEIKDYSGNDYCITLDGKEISGEPGEFLIPIQSIRSDNYTLTVANNADTPKTVSKSTCFTIAMIENFTLESVHNDKKVKFSWEVNGDNADPTKGVHIEFAGDSMELKSAGTEFDGTFSEDQETDFVLAAFTKDCQKSYCSQPEKYTPPVIKKFQEKTELTDSNCQRFLDKMAGDNGFLDARELFLHLEDQDICTGFQIPCRGKPPKYTYKFSFEWELNKECDCTVTLSCGTSKSFSNIKSGTCTLSSSYSQESATLKAVDTYGYEIFKNSGELKAEGNR